VNALATSTSHLGHARAGAQTRIGVFSPRWDQRTEGKPSSSGRSTWRSCSPSAEIAADHINYLQPEPLLQSPYYALISAMEGYSAPTYAYARNNPVHWVDDNGLQAVDSFTSSGLTFSASGEVIGKAVIAAGAGAALGTEMSGNDVPQGEIDQMDDHIRKIDEADSNCAAGGSPDPNDPNKDPREKHRRDLEGWIKKLEKATNRLKNKAKREIVEKAIEHARDRINKPSPPAPPRP
jgi:hypothetical protein